MKAIAVRRGETRPTVVEVDRPEPTAGEALVRTLRVGIDGTDHEVISGNHGGFSEDTDFQVLGYETVGVVEDATATDLGQGDLVVPTVRRPPAGESTTEYFERGIVGAHGYMAKYFTSPRSFWSLFPGISGNTAS